MDEQARNQIPDEGDVVEFPEPQPIDAAMDYMFGGCDVCQGPGDGMMDEPILVCGGLMARHWRICRACRTRWVAGINLYSLDEDGDGAWEKWRLQAEGILPIPFLTEYQPVEGKTPEWARQAIHDLNERICRRSQAE